MAGNKGNQGAVSGNNFSPLWRTFGIALETIFIGFPMILLNGVSMIFIICSIVLSVLFSNNCVWSLTDFHWFQTVFICLFDDLSMVSL